VAFKIHQNSFSAGAPPRTPLGELTTLPRPLSRLERGHPSPHATPLDTDPPSALTMRPPRSPVRSTPMQNAHKFMKFTRQLANPSAYSYQWGLLIDVAKLQQTLDDVTVRVTVDLHERCQHDHRTACLVLASDVTHSGVQQHLDHVKLTVRHRVVKRRVTLTDSWPFNAYIHCVTLTFAERNRWVFSLSGFANLSTKITSQQEFRLSLFFCWAKTLSNSAQRKLNWIPLSDFLITSVFHQLPI